LASEQCIDSIMHGATINVSPSCYERKNTEKKDYNFGTSNLE